jgi:multiple sugar transport system substrate-binding protein
MSSACTSPSSSSATPKSDPNATLLVWTDSTRQAGFEMYKKSHPKVKMKIQTYDPASLLTKIQLFNRTGRGWPDVVFSGQPNDVAALSSPLFEYTQPLDSLVPKAVRDGFGTANASCKVDGKLVCLKNDLAQTVLWYNKPLMDKFGYTVPTTWDEYKDLGLRVATEHPGYIIGTAGSQFVYYDYLWSSGCPLQTVTGPDEVHIDTTDPTCTRVADLLDPLIAAGSVSRLSPFDPDVVKLGQKQKILMLPAASWFGDFVFKPEASYHSAEGTIAAAPYPMWEGEDKNYSGAAGGGIYLVSRHSADPQGAADIATWMATNNAYQVTAPTYPAYGPAAEAWAKRLASDAFYATDPFPVLQQQAALINPAEGPTRYPVEAPMTATVVQSVKSGGTIADGLPTLQSQLAELAQSVGYAVQ